MKSAKIKILGILVCGAAALFSAGCGDNNTVSKPETYNGVYQMNDEYKTTLVLKYKGEKIEVKGTEFPKYTVYRTDDDEKGGIYYGLYNGRHYYSKSSDDWNICIDGKGVFFMAAPMDPGIPNGRVDYGVFKDNSLVMQSGMAGWIMKGTYQKLDTPIPSDEDLAYDMTAKKNDYKKSMGWD